MSKIIKQVIKDPKTGVSKTYHWVKPTTRTVVVNGKTYFVSSLADSRAMEKAREPKEESEYPKRTFEYY